MLTMLAPQRAFTAEASTDAVGATICIEYCDARAPGDYSRPPPALTDG
ncbi:hypothetical protein [Streptomyces sp. AF1B]